MRVVWCLCSIFLGLILQSSAKVKAANKFYNPRYPLDQIGYSVSIQKLNDGVYTHLCTGVYMGRGYVITSANCVYGLSKSTLFGFRGTSTSGEDLTPFRYSVADIQYNKYKPTTKQNDVAILRLKSSSNGYIFSYPDKKDSNFFSMVPVLPNPDFKTGVDGTNGCFSFTYSQDPSNNEYYFNRFEMFMIPEANCTAIYGKQLSANKVCAFSFFNICAAKSILLCYPFGNKYVDYVVAGVEFNSAYCSSNGTTLFTSLVPDHLAWVNKTINLP